MIKLSERLEVLSCTNLTPHHVFHGEEFIYHRISNDDKSLIIKYFDVTCTEVITEQQLGKNLYKLNIPQSVTAGSYPNVISEDALLNIDEKRFNGILTCHAVIRLKVSDIEGEDIPSGNPKFASSFSMTLIHVPYLANGAHSVITINNLDYESALNKEIVPPMVKRKLPSHLRGKIFQLIKDGRKVMVHMPNTIDIEDDRLA